MGSEIIINYLEAVNLSGSLHLYMGRGKKSFEDLVAGQMDKCALEFRCSSSTQQARLVSFLWCT
jgi:hypothetical protein